MPKTILIIDDDLKTAEALSSYLQNEDYVVEIARGGAKGLELACSRAFDLIISDVNMPDINGFELFEQLGKRGIETRVIAATAQYTTTDDTVRLMRLGVCDVLHKDKITRDFIRDRVARAMQLSSQRNLAEAPAILDILASRVRTLQDKLEQSEALRSSETKQREIVRGFVRTAVVILLSAAVGLLWAVGALKAGYEVAASIVVSSIIVMIPWERVGRLVIGSGDSKVSVDVTTQE